MLLSKDTIQKPQINRCNRNCNNKPIIRKSALFFCKKFVKTNKQVSPAQCTPYFLLPKIFMFLSTLQKCCIGGNILSKCGWIPGLFHLILTVHVTANTITRTLETSSGNHYSYKVFQIYLMSSIWKILKICLHLYS